MPARNNIHVPRESWPKFSWFLIEFAIVIAVAVVIAWQTSPLFEDFVVKLGLNLGALFTYSSKTGRYVKDRCFSFLKIKT